MKKVFKSLRRSLGVIAVAMAGVMPLTQAWSATQDTRPIRWIVSFPPGGATDIYARALAVEVEKILGRNIVIENKPGASTFIGVQTMKSAKPDGTTMLVVANDTLTINPHLFKAPYDVSKDFEFVAMYGETFPAVLLAKSDFPVSTLEEAIPYIKSNASTLNYASHGVGTVSHIRMEVLLSELGAKVSHVPYKGSTAALQDLAGGQVDLLVDSQVTALQMIKTGKVKPIAVMGKARIPELPDTMSVDEAGVGGGEFSTFQGLVAPAGTPSEQVEAMAAAIKVAVDSPELQKVFEARGLKPVFIDGKAFQELVLDRTKQMGQVIAEKGITIPN